MLYYGVVEDIEDPLGDGRVRVRVFGLHTDNTNSIKTSDLKWAGVLSSTDSASVSGIGVSPTGLLPGSWVALDFIDTEQQYPLIIGSITGIPANLGTQGRALDDVLFNASTDADQTDSNATKGTYTPTEDTSSVSLPDENNPDDLSGMPTTPPAGTANASTAASNIQIIIAECKKQGLTSRRAVATVLALVGGESGWIPVNEKFNYSAKRLVEVFPSVFPTLESAQPYANNATALPEKLYGASTSKGRGLGNTQAGDGAKYICRGFIQLTGRYNYTYFGNAAGVDLINNPESLSNPSISAKVAVAYVRIKTQGVSQNSDSYFSTAKAKVGNNTSDIAIKKKKYYDYFMSGVDTSKDQNSTIDTTTDPKKFDITSANSATVYGSVSGFRDPSGKYPLYYDESDVSRLARRQNIDKTIVSKKNANRVTGIESGHVTWSEQLSPYNATYPNNLVRETKSGHVIELDDTPNSERIHVYHTSGSYIEIDNTGSRTTRIVGSSYEIIDCNGHIYIAGAANITIGGSANINVGGDANIAISGDTNMGVGGDFNLHAQNIRMEADNSFSIKASASVDMDGSSVNLNSGTSEDSGVDKPSNSSGSTKENPVPSKYTDSRAVLYEMGESGGDALIKEAVARGEITAEEATKKPTEGDSTTETGSNQSLIATNCAQIASMDKYPDNLKISPNFTLGQVSSKAAVSSASVRDQNGLTAAEIVCNLQNVCLNVLESVLKKYPNAFVTSGFRYPGNNAKSQHPNGQAVDIQFKGVSKADYYKIAADLSASLPVFDQFLLEYAVTTNSPWIHISCTRTSNRRQIMTFYNHKKYKDGLVDLS